MASLQMNGKEGNKNLYFNDYEVDGTSLPTFLYKRKKEDL
jgi:hypothetical protein